MTQAELDKYLEQNIKRINDAKSQNEIKEIISEQNKTIEEWVKAQFK